MLQVESGATPSSGDGEIGRAVDTAVPADSRRGKAITIRLAEERDAAQAGALMRQLHEASVFADLPFSEDRLERQLDRIRARPKTMVALVAQFADDLVGFAWASAGPYLLCEEGLMTTVHVIAVDADRLSPALRAVAFLKLVKGVRAWSTSIGAAHTLIHVTTGAPLMKPADKLLRAAGAKVIGGGYVV